MSAVKVNIAHEQFFFPSQHLKHICPEKNTVKPAAKRFQTDDSILQTPSVPLPSNQV